MKLIKSCFVCLAVVRAVVVLSTSAHAQPPTNGNALRDLPLLHKWSGDSPLAHLD